MQLTAIPQGSLDFVLGGEDVEKDISPEQKELPGEDGFRMVVNHPRSVRRQLLGDQPSPLPLLRFDYRSPAYLLAFLPLFDIYHDAYFPTHLGKCQVLHLTQLDRPALRIPDLVRDFGAPGSRLKTR